MEILVKMDRFQIKQNVLNLKSTLVFNDKQSREKAARNEASTSIQIKNNNQKAIW